MLRDEALARLSTIADTAIGLGTRALARQLPSVSAIFGLTVAVAVVLVPAHAYAVKTCIEVSTSMSPKQTPERTSMNSLPRLSESKS